MLNVGSQTVPSLRRGGTDGESKRGAASERTPLSLCDTSPRRGWVQHRGPLSRRTEPDAKDRGTPPENLKGADPRNGGRQPEDWFSGTLRGTFLTQAGSSSCRRSTTDVLDFAYCMLEVASGFYFLNSCLPRLCSGDRVGCGKLHDWSSWSFGFRLKGPVLTTSRRTDLDFVVGVVSAPVSPRASLRCKGLGSFSAAQRRGATANLDSRYGVITLNAVCIKKWPRSES